MMFNVSSLHRMQKQKEHGFEKVTCLLASRQTLVVLVL